MKELVKKETITSLEVAELTGKAHKNVTRDIDVLLEQGLDVLNFGQTYYTDKANRPQRMYVLTKKGALILASGYNALLRETIINRLEELENELKAYKSLRVESTKARNGLTDEWKKQGCDKPHHYINLTKEEYETLFNDKKKKKADMNEKELAKLTAFEAFQRWLLLDKKEIGYNGCKEQIQQSKDIFGVLT